MVQVPPGVPPGMQFHANIGGQLVAVVVPQGVVAGQQLQIQVPVRTQMPIAQAAPPPRPVAAPRQQVAAPRPQPAPRPSSAPKTMNEELADKRAAQARAKELADMRKEMAKEAEQRAAEARRNPSAPPQAPQQPAKTYVNREGMPVNAKGEVSALWWLGMGL